MVQCSLLLLLLSAGGAYSNIGKDAAVIPHPTTNGFQTNNLSNKLLVAQDTFALKKLIRRKQVVNKLNPRQRRPPSGVVVYCEVA